MAQLSAIAAFMAMMTASRFRTGSAPGNPRHTGQTLLLGGSPKRVEQEQNILDLVRSWTCTSRPITASYLVRTSVATGIFPLELKKFSRLRVIRSMRHSREQQATRRFTL